MTTMRIHPKKGLVFSHVLLICIKLSAHQSNGFCFESRREVQLSRFGSCRWQKVDDSEGSSIIPAESRHRVTFSAESTLAATNPIDSFLTVITSDVGSIGLGLFGVLVLLVNRLFFFADDESTSLGVLEQETRSNILALVACGSVLLNGVSKLNVETVLAETVELEGARYDEIIFKDDKSSFLDQQQRTTIEWALSALLTATPSSSAVLLQFVDESWQIVGRTGALPDNDQQVLSPTPILDRFRADDMQQESYLPTLQNLPGRVEFTYLPNNTQAVVLVPAGPSIVLVLGSNRARSYTPRDIAWCLTVASRLAKEST